jgi:hypothetical protein
MSVHKFISDTKLVEYLDQEVALCLLKNDVNDISNYGWLSETTEDPEYIGHAMWQTDPPLETEWDYLLDDGPVKHLPSEKEKVQTIAGHDFEGLMKAARLSIGLTLLYQSIAEKNPISDNHYFWLHNVDAIFQLNMASDRIREYFIVSFFDVSSDTYKKRGNKYGKYVAPFIEIMNMTHKDSIENNMTNAIDCLPNLANSIHIFRKERNLIVHEIATKLGKNNKVLIEKQQLAYNNNTYLKNNRSTPSYKELQEQQSAIEKSHKEELTQAVKVLIDCYKTLIKLSSFVFEAEYWSRKCMKA